VELAGDIAITLRDFIHPQITFIFYVLSLSRTADARLLPNVVN